MATPRLFQDLRTALACLYSLSPGAAATHVDSAKAHDFLLHLQTRNVRRKLYSIQQSGRDQQQKRTKDETSNKLADEVQGSTWLACLALLTCAQADYAERLFAAQTLMHRLRRVKLSDAIDLEVEDPNQFLDSTTLNVNLVPLTTDYAQWMHQLHPVLASLVTQFLTEHPISKASDEEQVKGELAMLTLAAITYLTAVHAREDAHIQPLLDTLGSSLAAISLRLRFTPRSVMNPEQKATPTSAPLVTMMVHSLSAAVTADSNNTTTVTTQQQSAALFTCTCSCLGAIPEALLSSGGGAMGRISIDPRCTQAAHEELRQPSTGIYLLWEALRHYNMEDALRIRANVLGTCEKWAKCLPLPQDFVDYTVPLAGQLLSSSAHHSSAHPSMTNTALSYLIAIFESGSWTSKYILTFSLGLSSDQTSQPSNKKRQSSRSKRRQQERLDTSATDNLRAQAEAECRHRGEMACRTTRLVWEGLSAAVQTSLAQSVNIGGGEGPVGCLCACANACLPHWLRHSSSSEDATLAVSIMELFQEICSHSNRAVRVLAYEPLYTLNTTLLEATRLRYQQTPPQPPTEMETVVANHLYQCSMRLATSSGYPQDYFDQLDVDNDEEVEVERNDARDLIRAVCGCEGDIARGDTSIPMDVSMEILRQIVQSVAQACDTGTVLPPETAVHALSALAKPLNVLADAYTKGYRCEGIAETLLLLILALGNVHRSTIVVFENKASFKDVFPVSRLANLATAAFAPSLSALCKLTTYLRDTDQNLSKTACETVDVSVHAAALSIVHIPELAAESTLDHSQYDIRGAMRGPGGEDHVGCLALMRLAFESDELAAAMMTTNERNASASSLPLELCGLHEKLKSLENERGPGVAHGPGVAGKSRRILCQTICHLVLLNSDNEQDREAVAVLNDMFLSLIASVAELASSPAITGDTERIYRICEGVLDLSAFSPSMVSRIFEDGVDESSSIRQRFINGVVETCQCGYSGFPAAAPDDAIIQWARLRGALVGLLRASASPDLPTTARDTLILLNRSELQAIAAQCALGPTSVSPIFAESVISESSIPSGVFVRLLGEIVAQQQEQGYLSAKNCVAALQALQPLALDVLLTQCPEPKNSSFEDPRPTFCEAWYLSLNDLIASLGSANHVAYLSDVPTHALLSDTCCTALLLLLYAPLQRNPKAATPNSVGMSLDGPQTRAMLLFLESYFLLGPEMLRGVVLALRHRLDVDVASLPVPHEDTTSQGLSILGACLFRAASGGLPPWAIEVIPSLYAALFTACGSDPDVFCQMLRLSMDVRLCKTSKGFGAVASGDLLGGHYFASAKQAARCTFINKSREACRVNNTNGWRQFKVLLKQACGGKKKSSLSLKPSFTIWDVERI